MESLKRANEHARAARFLRLEFTKTRRGRLCNLKLITARRDQKMANSPQAKKRARQNERRAAVNKARRSRIRTHLRAVEEAIASGDKDAATAALKAAQPELMRGVSRGVFHKNTASRKISRLNARVKALS